MRIVFYDLETTGMSHSDKHRNVQILQIGAVAEDSDDEVFDQFLLPTCEIDPAATKIHGIATGRHDGLVVNNKKVAAVEMKLGLERFLSWLERLDDRILLVGYNSYKFDNWVLCHNLLRCGLAPPEAGFGPNRVFGQTVS